MEIIGKSPAIKQVKELILQVAKTRANVLILGESGTGKELVANLIHKNSDRNNEAYIPVNCGAIPAELLESELFGHEKGSFTGAQNMRRGRFELADRGSVFLDEIGDMPLNMQVKLLRVLQERKFERVGGTRAIETDVRVIAATHRDLEQLIQENKFREDLFYRLNVFPITLAPLRERLEDLPLLCEFFINNIAKEQAVCILSDDVIAAFNNYSWPGNVRELSNIIERLCILYPNKTVAVSDLPQHIINPQATTEKIEGFSETVLVKPNLLDGDFDLKQYIVDTEKELITQALKMTGGVVSRAAIKLSIRRTTLVEKMKKYKMNKDIVNS